MMSDGLALTHSPVLSLQAEMEEDRRFQALCEKLDLPWDFEAGYRPRGYHGPAPEQVKLLVLLAEPGAISPTEGKNLLPAISHNHWIGGFDLRSQEHYRRGNLQKLCSYVWPESTEDNMYEYLGKSNAFLDVPSFRRTNRSGHARAASILLAHVLAALPGIVSERHRPGSRWKGAVATEECAR